MTKYVSTDSDNCPYITAGKRYVVARDMGCGKVFTIIDDEGDEITCGYEYSGHINGNWTVHEEPDEMKYKVGDKVKVTGDEGTHGFNIGEVVTIRDFDSVDPEYRAHNDEGVDYWVSEGELSPILENEQDSDAPTGTLEELDLKPGDVVEFVRVADGFLIDYEHFVGSTWVVEDSESVYSSALDDRFYFGAAHTFKLISRESDSRVLFKDLTPEEKGALLLAQYEDKEIQFYSDMLGEWIPCELGSDGDLVYRVKPESEVETVTMYGGFFTDHWDFISSDCEDKVTHMITFTTTDGKPDLESIKMEEL